MGKKDEEGRERKEKEAILERDRKIGKMQPKIR
jgi:hypothetical protein